jgi:hypothetical protein
MSKVPIPEFADEAAWIAWARKAIGVVKASDIRIRNRRHRRHNRVVTASDEVKLQGEPLHEIWWRGRQWAVTEYGVEALDGTYAIEGSRLLEDLPEYSWLEHMSGKRWVDPDDFATAWLVGLLLHGCAARAPAPAALLQLFGKLPPVRR